MVKVIKYGANRLTIEENGANVILDIENWGGGASGSFPLSRVRNLLNEIPPIKPSRLEKQLYDSLEYLLCELYADGPSKKGEDRASRALHNYTKKYGGNHVLL